MFTLDEEDTDSVIFWLIVYACSVIDNGVLVPLNVLHTWISIPFFLFGQNSITRWWSLGNGSAPIHDLTVLGKSHGISTLLSMYYAKSVPRATIAMWTMDLFLLFGVVVYLLVWFVLLCVCVFRALQPHGFRELISRLEPSQKSLNMAPLLEFWCS
jgi:hypothetical protein